MKLLVDMNLSPRWIDLLTRSQFEAVHWSSLGHPQALDEEIMAYAAKHDYIVLTNDLGFQCDSGGHAPRKAKRRTNSLREPEPGRSWSANDQSSAAA